MNTNDFDRIATAINYLKENFKQQPTLEAVAGQVSLSPFHFQKMFSDWAGVSPKKFLQYLSIEHAKGMLKEKQATLFDTAIETGLSGTSRLHDLFISIEGMTPGEFKNGGEMLKINYSFSETVFGNIIIASTGKGICYLAFYENKNEAFEKLRKNFPNAKYEQLSDIYQAKALSFFSKNWDDAAAIKLHLKGTPFQLKVWEALLKIPMGRLATYSSIAKTVGTERASRAVGSAVGDNPVAFLIPCHRVIRSTGEFGNYHWGPARKSAMIGWEACGA
ncbi:MAG: methylated-DNA--[protein]-cysteine S-methyltransferase [Chitinophagaceae bacterium]|nr:methylated-DNA--[protein]-cysteine S-methyltransferase [Chitinophagaceae bacterium]